MNQQTMEKYLIGQAMEKGVPITGSLELLPLCNMNCDMCFVRLDRKEMESQGRLRTIEEWKAIGDQMQSAGVMFLMLTGGEPLLYPDFKELYLYLKNLGMIITVNTNGTLIDREWVEFFHENPPRRLNITLYGASPETYEKLCHCRDGYEKTVNAIRMLRKAGIDVKINGSLTEANKDEYEQLMKLAYELGCPINIDTHMQPAVRERKKPFDRQSRMNPEDAAVRSVAIMKLEKSEEEYYRIISEMLDKVKYREDNLNDNIQPVGIKCQAGRSSFVINWQGQMRPCVMMPFPEIDALSEDFDSAWKKLKEGCKKLLLNEKCFSCIYRDICGTCPACGLHEAGDVSALPEYMCRYTEERYRLMAEDYKMMHHASQHQEVKTHENQ